MKKIRIVTDSSCDLNKDIVEKYPHINPENYFNISSMIRDTNDKFIFLLFWFNKSTNEKPIPAHRNPFNVWSIVSQNGIIP